MEGVKNFTSCLKILEDQGFEAEHMLLVQLFGCLETYWNTSNVGNVENQGNAVNSSLIIKANMEDLDFQRDASNSKLVEKDVGNLFVRKDLTNSDLIEEGEIEFVGENVISTDMSVEVKSEKFPKMKRKRKTTGDMTVLHGSDKIEDVESGLISELTAIDQNLAKRKKKDSPKRKGSQRIPRNTIPNPEVTSRHCKYCQFKIPGMIRIPGKLRRHNRTEHFVCEICKKKHDNEDGLEKHMNSLHKDIEGRVVCGVNGCDKKHQQLSITLEHVRAFHDRVADRICKDCDKPYIKLKTHRRQHHMDPSSMKTCTACDYTCISNNSLLIHKRRRHPKPGKRLSCASCDFQTSGLSQDEEYKLIIHKKIHQDGEMICTMCPFKSAKPFALKRHLAEEHNIGHVFQCNQCDHKTGGPTAKGHMKIHMARHAKEKNFQCDQCEFSGYTKFSLDSHMLRHISNTPKYICDECEYNSNDSSNFQAHRQVKHGSVVLSCQDCDYSTKSKRSLRDHSKKHSTTMSMKSFLM